MPLLRRQNEVTLPTHWASDIVPPVIQSNRSCPGGAVSWNESVEDTILLRDRRRRHRRQEVVNCCKKLVAYLFSHVGLAGMVVAYSILGGFLFRALEAPHELEVKVAVGRFKREKLDEITRLHESQGENFTKGVRLIFAEFQRKVVEEVKMNGWDGKDYDNDDDAKLQWSFAGALLYAVTVVTTIGYGHIAPKTTWGRMITILYALIGIPLTFLYLSNIGNFLADCFRLFYKRICCDVCCCEKCKREQKRLKRKIRQQREFFKPATSQKAVRITSTTCGSVGTCNGNDVMIVHNSLSGQTVPKARGSDTPSISKPETPSCKTVKEFKPETVKKNRANVSNGIKRVSSGPSSLSVTRTPQSRAVSVYENLRETEILDDKISSSMVELPNVDVVERISNRKRQRLAIREMEERMLMDFINSKETDLVENICTPVGNFKLPLGNSPCQRDDSINASESNEASLVVQTETETLVKPNRTPKPTQVHSKPNVSDLEVPRITNIVKPEASDDQRNWYFHRRPGKKRSLELAGVVMPAENVVKAASTASPSSSSTAATATAVVMTSSDRKSRKRCRVLSEDGKEWNKLRLQNGYIARSQSNPKSESPLGSMTSNGSKVKRSATIGGPDIASAFKADGSVSNARLISRSRNRLTAQSPIRRPMVRHESFDGFKRVFVSGSTESFVTAYGDSDVHFDANRTSGYDVKDSTKTARFAARATNCRTNNCKNITSAADEADGTVFSPLEHSSRDVRSASSCVKDSQLPVDSNDTERRLMPFLIVDDNEDDALENDDMSRRRGSSSSSTDDDADVKVSVPISICLIIIGVYVVAGSALFAVWEGWDYLTGSYFCFVTLSTIGFGDVVPGTDMDQWASREKLVLCVLWLAFGLSLLAMCFNLMQEEVKDKCKWIGRKLGLLKDEGAR